MIDVVLDTDAFNEIDDQFAIAYLLRSKDKLNTVAFYAAPFSNSKAASPSDGMRLSYDEILKIEKLCGEEREVFKGSESYLHDESTPVESDAANDLVMRAKNYSRENPLYVVAIGAITNIASALIKDASIAENLVIVWLGGNARHIGSTREFNMYQDYAAARVVMSSNAKFIQLPCTGVVSEFRISKPELEYWLAGKNPLADYLAKNAIAEADSYAEGKPWTRVVWDVTAVGYLLNENSKFMNCDSVKTYLPSYDGIYEKEPIDKEMIYVKSVKRDALMEDLIEKLIR